jgi:pimeloyl-ACP methyl ester carboxylesterase
MTVVLLHGNPETPAIWGPLIAALGRDDVITPRLPGFGVPTPEGFGATWREYIDWFVGVLESIGEPVDVVGHDWGAGIALPAVCERPDLFRSWATDCTGLFDPTYVWHDMAQVWQTPNDGEAAVAAWADMPDDDKRQLFVSLGMTPDIANDLAAALDMEMGRCVLALYRSAAQPALSEYAASMLSNASQRPGLAIAATDDPYVGGVEAQRRAAGIAKCQVGVLDDLGHWWMVQDPARGASLLSEFWSSV